MTAFSNFGVNFGHIGTDWSEPGLSSNLNIIKYAGFDRIRVNLPVYTTEASNIIFRNQLRLICTTALSLGFYVCWGYTVNGGSNLTNTTMNGVYHDAFTSLASWAQSLNQTNKFEIILGNEDDGRVDGVTVTTSQYQEYIRGTLCNDVKEIFTNGYVSYNTHTGYQSNWKTNGLGSLDKFGLNLYDNLTNFSVNAKGIVNSFGTKSYISEWNSNDGYNDFNNDILHAGDIQERREILLINNLPNYIYNFNVSSDYQKWALQKTDMTYRLAWNVITQKRRFLT